MTRHKSRRSSAATPNRGRNRLCGGVLTVGLVLMELCGVVVAAGPTNRRHSKRPNVIIVLTDDQGFGDVGVHSNRKIETPHLDRFARQGIELTRFYCSPVCAPTRAALTTGRYYYRSGVIHTSRGGAKMHGEEVTLAERLLKAGYRTGIFGKWHLGDTFPMRPQDQGFEETLVHKSGGIGQTPDKPNSYFNPLLWRNGKRIRARGYCTDVFFTAATAFIEKHREKPFFVYLATNAPHTPLEVDEKYSRPYRKKGLDATTAKVYGMVTNIDENFGRLLKTLDRLKLRRNTLVIFLGDNGPQQRRFNAGLRGRKGSTYEGGLRVPCFLQWPARLRGKRKIDRIAAHIDLAPTILAACAVRSGDGPKFDGKNLLPLLEQKDAKWPERRLYFQCHRSLSPTPFRNCAVVSQRYKLVGGPGTFSRPAKNRNGSPKLELYDLAQDPGESRNVIDRFPKVAAKLRAGYEAWFADVKSTRGFTPGVIHLGSKAENPVTLCRYQDGTYRNGTPQGWSVRIVRGGRYRLTFRRGKITGDGTLNVRWKGRQIQKELKAGARSAVVSLSAGTGTIDVWFAKGDNRRVVVRDNSTTGDVIVARLAGKPKNRKQ